MPYGRGGAGNLAQPPEGAKQLTTVNSDISRRHMVYHADFICRTWRRAQIQIETLKKSNEMQRPPRVQENTHIQGEGKFPPEFPN
jgi:hypothetical protein